MDERYHHVLIDGRNVLYRAIFAEFSGIRPGDTLRERYPGHVLKVFIKFLSQYRERFRPEHFHVFWDDKTKKVWRKTLLPEYKEGTTRKHITPGLAELMSRQFYWAGPVLDAMGIRQYKREEQEADDLIYAFCADTRKSCCLVSSDGDLKQIPQRMTYVDQYNPMHKASEKGAEPIPDCDVVLQKSLMGDKSDNIQGYAGIGPKRARALALDLVALEEFITSDKAMVLVTEDGEKRKMPAGPDLFTRNLDLIDLSRAPSLNENVAYVRGVRDAPLHYDHGRLISTLKDLGLKTIREEAHNICLPFSGLAKRL